MTVLVTGGAGYIGSHMVLELVDAGQKVVVLDNLSTGLLSAVPDGTTFVEGDVGEQPLVRQIIETEGVESIIHFAGSIVVPDSVADPLGYYLNNTVKSRSLIEAAVKTGVCNFIFSSTAAVYGMAGENPVAEDSPLMPFSPYGASKLMTEMMLSDVARAHDLRYVALRYFNVTGADPHGRSGQSSPTATHLLKVACEVALGRRSHLNVFGSDYPTADGTCVRDYIHVTDLVRAHTAALHYLSKGGQSGAFNCGYGRGFSVFEVIEAVKRVCGHNIDVRLAPRRPADPAILIAAPNKLRSHMGWKPEHDDLDQIVRHALRWEERLPFPGTAN